MLPPHQQRHAAGLRWLFQLSESELGLKSNFAGMVASLEGGGFSARNSYDVDERRLQAAERARLARRALEVVPPWAVVVLRLLYRRPGGEERLLCALKSTNEEHRRSRTRRDLRDWLERLRTNDKQARRNLYARLDAEATSVARDAVGLYAKAYNTLKPRSRSVEDRLAR